MGILPISRSLIKALLPFYSFTLLPFYFFTFLPFYFYTFFSLCITLPLP